MAGSRRVSSDLSDAGSDEEDFILGVTDGITSANLREGSRPGAPAGDLLQPQPARRLPGRPVDHASAGPGGSDGPGQTRVVGPGRLERRYIDRITELQRTVETAELVERGSARLMDRVEHDLERSRTALSGERQQKSRLLVGMGALQRENESLRARVLQLEGGPPELAALTGRRRQRRAPRPGFWARVFASFARKR